jgi:hypothetical protein
MQFNRIKNEIYERYYLLVTLLISLGAVIILSYSTSLILNWDISWLMTTTGRLFEGQLYGDGFFENSPPIINLILFPPWLIHHYFDINLTVCFYSYVTLITWVSCYFCNLWIQKRWGKSNPIFAKFLYFSILMSFYIVPLTDYGQKDYLFWVFFLPYLFGIIHQLHHQKLSYPTGIFIGFWLFLGVGIKHFFLIPVIAVECFMMFEKRQCFAWRRPESITFAILCCLYMLIIKIYFPGYLTVIVPIALKLHYLTIGMPISNLIFSNWMFLLLLFNLTFLLGYQFHPFKKEMVLLNIVLNSCALIFMLQRTFWYYHLIPFMACLQLNIILNSMLIKNIKHTPTPVIFFTFYSMIFTYIFCFSAGAKLLSLTDSRNKILMSLSSFFESYPNSFFINNDIWPQSPLYQHNKKPLLSYHPWVNWNRLLKYPHQTPEVLNLVDQLNIQLVQEIKTINPDYLMMNRNILISKKFYPWKSDLNLYLYLSENENFRPILKNYVYYETILYSNDCNRNKSAIITIKKLTSPNEISTLSAKSTHFVAFKNEHYRYIYPIKNGHFKKIDGQIERYLHPTNKKAIYQYALVYDVFKKKGSHPHAHTWGAPLEEIK